jgi:MoaA/NifB/PqqE/SkfB family radical SAM enzyme
VIQVRYENDSNISLAMDSPTGVVITNDPATIALESEKNGYVQRRAVDTYLKHIFERAWATTQPLFHLISIETRAGCNYSCRFCPVAHNVDPREPGEMSWDLLRKIARELADLNYDARIALFGNNEPLMDPRLPEITRLFRSRCPEADIRVLTNGTLTTGALVADLFEAGLSTLVINNYTDGQRLIQPVRKLLECSTRFLPFDIRISVRSRTAVLTTRAGLAPNKPTPSAGPHGFCALPFTDFYVNYRGRANLCCFDAHGKVEIGDVQKRPIQALWKSPELNVYRQSLLRSERSGLTLCENCDYDGFREPVFRRNQPIIRADIIAASDSIPT